MLSGLPDRFLREPPQRWSSRGGCQFRQRTSAPPAGGFGLPGPV